MSAAESYSARQSAVKDKSSKKESGAEETRELQEKIIRQERRIGELLEDIKNLKAQKRGVEESLQNILTSRSWRLTSCLRRIAAGVRSLFPLLRFGRFRMGLEPEKNVVSENGKFRVTGTTPSLMLTHPDGKVPTGWVYINADIATGKVPLFFLLYFGCRRDFNPVNRTWLTFAAEKSSSHMFRIPEWTTELRLDPFNCDEEFSFNTLEIRGIGKLQVLWHILKVQLSPVILHPPLLFKKISKLTALLREGGLNAVRARLFANDYTSNYQEWVKKYDTLSEQDRDDIRKDIAGLKLHPKFSVVMPVYNVPEKWLRLAIESVKKQLYPEWELCIADDASNEPHVRRVLDEYTAQDSRIKVVYREKNGHISEASNSALELATGDFIALLDNDDELTEDALYMVARSVNDNPRADLFYSDEDKKTSYGMRCNPYFKPDWNEELFLQQNFICHLGVYRTSVVKELGGFRNGLEGAQDWDLALRVIARSGPDKVVHIPHVLYHWRVIEGSTAQSTDYKPYVMEAQARAVREYLESTGASGAEVKILEHISQLRVCFPVPAHKPLVSIIIPTKDQAGYLKRCVGSILEKSLYRNIEIIIVDNGSAEKETEELFGELARSSNIRILPDHRPFNFSQLNNGAAREARGEVLAFLNNDLEVISKDWLDEMLASLYRPGVGAVGAKLYYPHDVIQHAGVVTGIGGVAGHSHKGRLRQDPGYFNKCILTQAMAGVTAACMLVRKDVFEEAGGFDEEQLAVAFNDVDLCMKIREKGHRIVFNAYAELYHYESISRGFEDTPKKFRRFEGEIEVMKKRWGDRLEKDPFYSPNLTLLTEDFTFAFPPRAGKPWRQR